MSYNAEALLQLKVLSQGLNELITGIAELEGELPGAEKQLGSIQRRALSLDKDLQSLAGAEGKVAKSTDGVTASMTRADAATKGWSKSLASGWAAQFGREIDVMAAKLNSFEQISNKVSQAVAQKQLGLNTSALSGAELASFSSLQSGLAVTGAKYSALGGAAKAEQEAAALQAAEQAGRGYLNTSVAIDSAIAQRTAESKTFSNQLRAQMQAEADEEAAARKVADAQRLVGQSLSTTRTSLYDASRTLTTWSVGLLALPIASAVVAASYQRDFATVSRSLVGSKYNSDALQQSLINLSETIPVSFKGITNIAGAGAQLGIGASGLVSFTKVVAELTSTTNLTADAAENFLGKFKAIGGVNPSQFTQLASAVLDVGVHTAATEQQIAQAATGIVGIGKEAGFTTPQIIGLAGALTSVSSSIRNPQLIRGTMTRFVTDISSAVRTGGPALEAYAKTAGLSTDAVQKAFGTAAFAGTFQKFIGGLDDIQKAGGDTVGVLNAIGIHSVQDIPLLLNLASGHDTLAEAMKRANEGWNNSYLLQEHFDKINQTLVSHVKEAGNALGALFNDLGKSSTGPLNSLVQGFTDATKAVDGFVKSPIGGYVSGAALALLAFAGAATLAFALISKGAAGVIAIGQALDGLAARRAANTAVTVAETAATEANTAANVANAESASGVSRALGALGAVAKGAGVAALVVGAGQLAGSLFGAADDAFEKSQGFNTDTLKGQINLVSSKKSPIAVGGQSALKGDATSNAQDLGRFEANLNLFGTASTGSLAIKKLDESLAHLAAGGPKNFDVLSAGLSSLAKQNDLTMKQMLPSLPALSGELDKLGIKYKEVGNYVTFYASKSASAATQAKAAALTFQFYTGLTAKQATALGKAYADSVQPLTDFNTVMGDVQSGLKAADSNYDGVSVSVQQFTDKMAANNVQQGKWFGNLTALNQQIVSETGDQGTANQITNQLLQAGYSVTNSSFLQQLVDAAPDQRAAYIKAMQDSMDATAKAAGQALIDSAGGHLKSKDGSPLDSTAIGQMLLGGWSPADIMKALNLELVANPAKPQADPKDANKTLDDLVTKWGGQAITMVANAYTGPAQNTIDSYIRLNNGRSLTIYVDYQGRNQGYVAPGGLSQPTGATGGYFTGTSFKYSNGGPVFGAGSGTSDQVPAWLSNGEYVIKANSVQALGRPYLDAINKYGAAATHRATGGPVGRTFAPTPHFAGGGPVTVQTPDVVTVQLSPYDRQLLEAAGNMQVIIPGQYIAKATSQSNAMSSSRGA